MSKEGPSGPLVKNVSPDGRGVKGGPFRPISKNESEGQGFKEGPFGQISKKTCRRTDGVSKEGPSGLLVKNVLPDGRSVKGGPFGPISKKRVAKRMGF